MVFLTKNANKANVVSIEIRNGSHLGGQELYRNSIACDSLSQVDLYYNLDNIFMNEPF